MVKVDTSYTLYMQSGNLAIPSEMVVRYSENNIKEQMGREENKRRVDNICKGDFLDRKNFR